MITGLGVGWGGAPIANGAFKLQNRMITNEDVQNVRAMGFRVNDDKEPVLENIPDPINMVMTAKDDLFARQSSFHICTEITSAAKRPCRNIFWENSVFGCRSLPMNQRLKVCDRK